MLVHLNMQFGQLLPWLLMALTVTGLAVMTYFFRRQVQTLRQFNQKNLFKNLKKLDLLYTLIDSMPDWIYIRDRERTRKYGLTIRSDRMCWYMRIRTCYIPYAAT